MSTSEVLPSRLIGLTKRLPESLADLAGPDHGRVALPVRLAWSGRTVFDVESDRQRLTLYRTLIDCGQRDDFIEYINADLLRRDWPRIRRLTSRAIIAAWERQLPELAAA